MQGSAFRDDVSQVTLGLTRLCLLVCTLLTGAAGSASQNCSDDSQCYPVKHLARFLVTICVWEWGKT